MGLRLDDWGLWRQDDYDLTGKREVHWSLLPAHTEEEVLQEIGMDYIEPMQRNFSNLSRQR